MIEGTATLIEDFAECADLPAGRRRICRCETDLPLTRINEYRAAWGLPPLRVDPRIRSRPAQRVPRPRSREKSQRVGRQTRRGFWESLTPSCGFLGQIVHTEHCGCGANKVTEIHECRLLTNARGNAVKCVPLAKHWGALKGEVKPSITCCESCPHRSPPRWIATRKLIEDTQRALSLIPAGITAVAGHARTGMIPASLLAGLLHVPLWMIRSHGAHRDVVPAGHGWRLDEGAPRAPGKLLVVDDNCMTGNSLTRLRPVVHPWAQAMGFVDIAELVIYANPLAQHLPQISVETVPWPCYYEWNFYNSTFSPGFALDFDGVLCRDCRPEEDDDGPRYLEFLRTASPLAFPRKKPIPLIVTARLEKYRGETLAWLDRHGIRCERLAMMPMPTHSGRTFERIVSHKARHFSDWATQQARKIDLRIGPRVFVESDPSQAEAIARKSGRLVICPAAERVFQG